MSFDVRKKANYKNASRRLRVSYEMLDDVAEETYGTPYNQLSASEKTKVSEKAVRKYPNFLGAYRE